MPVPRKSLYAPNKRRKKKTKNVSRREVAQIAKNVLQSEAEKKWVNSAVTGTQSSTASVTQLFYVAEGDGSAQRDGDEITAMSVHLKGLFQIADATNRLRIMLVHWRDGSGAPSAGLGQILQNVTAISDYFTSPYSMDRQREFSVLVDRQYYLDNTTKQEELVDIYYKFKGGLKLNFTGALASQPGDSALYLIVVSDSGAATHPQFDYNCLQRYIDF